MKQAQVNRRIQDFLRDLADEGTFRMRKKRGKFYIHKTMNSFVR
jgi:hypothetical protein